MTPQNYLELVLEDRKLSEDSEERKALRKQREKVEGILLKAFEQSNPTIRYGGSRIKGTMNREIYDLDIICYFERGDTAAGETLKDIYENVERSLANDYFVERKGSALRLHSLEQYPNRIDFHIDVVPGRFTDENRGDAYLYRSTGEKSRLKTNLQTHIDHVINSGLVDVIRLVKLWKHRNGLAVRTFALELVVIEVLKQSRQKDMLDRSLVALWEELRDNATGIHIEDPANPSGNDLSELLNDSIRLSLSLAAASSLRTIEQLGWEAVFGPIKDTSDNNRAPAIIVGGHLDPTGHRVTPRPSFGED
jgi:hypothetical protein